MNNIGKLGLTIRNVEDQPALDPQTRIDVKRRDGNAILRFKELNLPLDVQLEIPAFPQESNLLCDVTPKRYRSFFTEFFTLSTSTPRTIEACAMRLPKQWSAKFTGWNQLSDDFTPLKTVLENSDVKVIKGDNLGKFTESDYDSVSAEKTVLAKTALLNLFAKMTVLKEPIGGQHPWFSFGDRILAIDRERFYAVVKVEMKEVVRRVRDNPNKFKDYEPSNGKNHFEDLQNVLKKKFHIFRSEMFSIKSDERNGNLQLTMAPAKDLATGERALLLDVDIDENGDLLNHLIDVFFIHPFSGGTHPFDIHEYLVLAHRNRALGYDLV
ncbi:MAG: hypothetical protein ACREAB_20770 [Blastocatellia bacterium]